MRVGGSRRRALAKCRGLGVEGYKSSSGMLPRLDTTRETPDLERAKGWPGSGIGRWTHEGQYQRAGLARIRQMTIHNLLQEWRANFVCFQDTKMEEFSERVVRSLWRCQYAGWLFLRSRGASVGILLMWDRRVVEKIDEVVSSFSVSCLFRNVEDQRR